MQRDEKETDMATKTKIREGIVIGSAELKDGRLKREWHTTLICMSEYIGFVEIYDGNARLYVFSSKDGAVMALREAKNIGYRTAGMAVGPIYIRNADLHRPHLSRYRGYDFHREYYK